MELREIKLDEEIYIHKNGKIGFIVGTYFSDGACLIFEEIDPESGDIGFGSIFSTEAMYVEKCTRKQYNKMFPPENGCVSWEEHFHRHILVDKGLPTEQQVYVKDCPHCGGYEKNSPMYSGQYHKVITKNDTYQVKCVKCGSQGPEKKCLLESISAYNERF